MTGSRILLPALLAAMFCAAAARAADISIPGLKRSLKMAGEANSFWFTVLAADQELARDVLKAAEETLARVRRDLAITRPPAKKCLILVWGDQEAYVKGVVLSLGIRDGLDSKAFYVPSGDLRPHVVCLYRDQEMLSRILPHELTHLVLKIFLNPSGKYPIPLWLNEGLAECETDQPLDLPAGAVRKAKREGAYIPLQLLTAYRNYPEDFDRCRLFYEESACLVRFLLEEETYPGEFFELAKMLSFWGGEFIEGLKKVYGRKYGDFAFLEEDFGRFIEKHAREEAE